MDAVEFLNEYNRLCEYYIDNCKECPLHTTENCNIVEGKPNIEIIVSVTEQWSKEHPRKTRLQDFLEKYPNAPKMPDGVPRVCSAAIGYRDFCSVGYEEINCKRCWNEPVE